MKEEVKLSFPGILILICSMGAMAYVTGEYIFLGICAGIALISPLINFRFNISRRTEYIIYILFLILILLKHFFVPYKGLMFLSFIMIPGYFFILISLVMIYKVKYRNDILSIYFSSLFVLMVSGLTTMNYYFEYFLLAHLLLASFYLRDFIKYQYIVINFSFKLKQMAILSIVLIFSAGLFYFFNIFLVWLEPRMNFYIPPMDSGFEYSGFFNETSLNVTGNMKLSQKVILRVESSSSVERLRCKVFVNYKGGKWRTSPVKQEVSINNTSVFSEKHKKDYSNIFLSPFLYGELAKNITYCKVKVSSNFSTVFFTLPETFAVASNLSSVYVDQFGIFYPHSPEDGPDYGIYGITSSKVLCTEKEDLTQYLSLPEYLNPKIKALGTELTSPQKDINSRCLSVVSYFHNNFQYSLNFKPSRAGDPVEEFILDKKPAHCEYFATGMVLLLRSSGIPARYVTGFLVHEYNRTAGYYIVRERDAHAWVEAYVDGKWITFDPTPSGGLFQELLGDNNPGIINQIIDLLLVKFDDLKYLILKGDISLFFKKLWNKFLNLGPWLMENPLLLIIFFIFLLAMAFKNKLTLYLKISKGKSNILNKRADIIKLHKILKDFDNILKIKGINRKENMTLYEFIDYLKGASSEGEEIELYSGFIDNYCKIRYSQPVIKEEDLSSLREEVGKLEQIVLNKK